jgi:PAS domain S-box-containing protein
MPEALHRDDPDDLEIAALAASTAALSRLPDAEARRRVLSYVLARCLPAESASLPTSPGLPEMGQAASELPGIARLTGAGEFVITLRQLGARSRLEAAVRLARIAIYAHEFLAGRPLSSRKTLTPLLKAWGLYDGNTRSRLAREPGILRRGDELTLDGAARQSVERLLAGMLSPVREVEQDRGTRIWRPVGPDEEQRPAGGKPGRAGQLFEAFEDWDAFANQCSVGLHAVDANGTILWANRTELAYLGYRPEEYTGRFFGDFHVDQDVVQDILARLTRNETVNACPARLRAKDGSTRYVLINSNVSRGKGGEFRHSRCFTVGIDEPTWRRLRRTWERASAA